jgi:hypothetical protein
VNKKERVKEILNHLFSFIVVDDVINLLPLLLLLLLKARFFICFLSFAILYTYMHNVCKQEKKVEENLAL